MRQGTYWRKCEHEIRTLCSPKGQIISKAIFVFLTSPKKQTKKMKKFDLLLLWYIKWNLFRLFFLENLGHHKLLSKLTDIYMMKILTFDRLLTQFVIFLLTFCFAWGNFGTLLLNSWIKTCSIAQRDLIYLLDPPNFHTFLRPCNVM